MKKLLLIIPLVCLAILYLGFRTGGFRTNTTTVVDWTFSGDVDMDGDVYVDSLLVKILATVKDGPTGYATIFVDTTGTDSLIIMVGSTRRGIGIE